MCSLSSKGNGIPVPSSFSNAWHAGWCSFDMIDNGWQSVTVNLSANVMSMNFIELRNLVIGVLIDISACHCLIYPSARILLLFCIFNFVDESATRVVFCCGFAWIQQEFKVSLFLSLPLELRQ